MKFHGIVKGVKSRLHRLIESVCGLEPVPHRRDTNGVLYLNTDTAKDINSVFDANGRLKPPASPTDVKDEDHWWCYPGREAEASPVIEELNPEFITDELNRKIDRDEFPVIEIPANVMKTMQLLNKQDFDYVEVSALINHSPAMAGEFIRVINSSMFSRGVHINDLKTALPRLGRENIKALLYMYSSKMCFVRDPHFNDLAISIVDHSYAVGLIASYLSQRFYPDPDGAFLAGLLHDIGKLGILKAISDNYTLPDDAHFKIKDEAFDNIFPHLHERAGKFLASNWKINDVVMGAIEHHHDFSGIDFDESSQMNLHLSCIVNVADTMARILGCGRSIGPANIFAEPATIDLAMEKDIDTVKFLAEIPKILAFKVEGEASAQQVSLPEKKPRGGVLQNAS